MTWSGMTASACNGANGLTSSTTGTTVTAPGKREPPMDADEHRWEHDPLTEKVIGCAYTVANTLGHGFLEKVYENALAHELRNAGLRVAQQWPMEVRYDGVVVGEFAADLVVEERVMVELKAVKALDDVHMAQCINYLKAAGKKVCLLLNFGAPRIEVKRISL